MRSFVIIILKHCVCSSTDSQVLWQVPRQKCIYSVYLTQTGTNKSVKVRVASEVWRGSCLSGSAASSFSKSTRQHCWFHARIKLCANDCNLRFLIVQRWFASRVRARHPKALRRIYEGGIRLLLVLNLCKQYSAKGWLKLNKSIASVMSVQGKTQFRIFRCRVLQPTGALKKTFALSVVWLLMLCNFYQLQILTRSLHWSYMFFFCCVAGD